ncbi:hypothetical protein T4E_5308 [Trichinella pseudospiralis]|uniref:Copper transporter n=1 Tax=Trichinella pseudospiralis TaxID=6337 RepID=A0A0V0Y4B3_TRIPS|nr:hypothetical protein T4E_5308 [Trichinella pseudospiralis]
MLDDADADDDHRESVARTAFDHLPRPVAQHARPQLLQVRAIFTLFLFLGSMTFLGYMYVGLCLCLLVCSVRIVCAARQYQKQD